MKTLLDITGHESGLIQYDDGSVQILNWSHTSGIPRDFYGTPLGLQEDLDARDFTLVPNDKEHIRLLMQIHDGNEQDDTRADKDVTSVYSEKHGVTIVTHADWH